MFLISISNTAAKCKFIFWYDILIKFAQGYDYHIFSKLTLELFVTWLSRIQFSYHTFFLLICQKYEIFYAYTRYLQVVVHPLKICHNRHLKNVIIKFFLSNISTYLHYHIVDIISYIIYLSPTKSNKKTPPYTKQYKSYHHLTKYLHSILVNRK